MKWILYWPDGSWVYEDEEYNPELEEPQRVKVPIFWGDGQVDDFISSKIGAL